MLYMPAKPPVLFPASVRELAAFGERLRLARLRRRFPTELVARRANISRPTLRKIEKGDVGVALGNYFQVMKVLGLDNDFARLAADDEVGRRLQDAALAPAPPSRARADRASASADGE